LFKTEEKQLL
jgi:hypothetical protein